ncbi:MAG: hypothetical protein Q8S00_17535 [Deltaproteobacteria bacterium]|nr:hypothetical protein [Deltaproteobacteria bacterium]MDZ4345258.1 hypothetical protein [Candidatus Binatia bacterium]
MKIKLQTEVLDYARALRAIGQDLAKLVPHSLELEVVDNDYIVRGQTSAPQSPVAENANPSVWQRLQKKVGQREPQQSAPLLLPFERKYTPEDVTRLDETGAARRRGPDKPPEISGMAEKLRMIGRIVEAKSGRLSKIIDDMDSVTVEYYDEQGEFHSEKYSMLALYKIQQDYYGQRGSFKPMDPWRGFDR